MENNKVEKKDPSVDLPLGYVKRKLKRRIHTSYSSVLKKEMGYLHDMENRYYILQSNYKKVETDSNATEKTRLKLQSKAEEMLERIGKKRQYIARTVENHKREMNGMRPK